MLIQNKEEFTSAQELFVILAFDKEVSLDFKIKVSDPEALERILNRFPSANNFDSLAVLNALLKIAPEAHYFELGRDLSPVVKVHIPIYYQQQIKFKEGDTVGRIPYKEREKIVQAILDALEATHPDEFGYDSQQEVIRAWWD